jgi:chromosomal replication initiator protein
VHADGRTARRLLEAARSALAQRFGAAPGEIIFTSGGTEANALAIQALGAAITRPREILTVDAIIKVVASYYGLKPSDIKSERRHKSVSTPRAVAMYIARHNTKDSYPDIARAFGGKHHTTVISAVQKIQEKLKDDASLRSELHAIEQQIHR